MAIRSEKKTTSREHPTCNHLHQWFIPKPCNYVHNFINLALHASLCIHIHAWQWIKVCKTMPHTPNSSVHGPLPSSMAMKRRWFQAASPRRKTRRSNCRSTDPMVICGASNSVLGSKNFTTGIFDLQSICYDSLCMWFHMLYLLASTYAYENACMYVLET